MASYSYSPISVERAEIRLLVIEPGAWDANLECRLQHAVLTEMPPYEALSYTWGDANDVRPIALNGASWQVTANLESALRSLRQQDKPRTMWIDALCINQKDLVEKAQQVPRMRDIYRSATKVVAWLGPAGGGGDTAMEAIQDMMTKLGTMDKDWSIIGPNDLCEVGIDVAQINWLSIWSFLNRPYWRRIWVIQELASCTDRGVVAEDNEKGTIMCGSKSMSKAEFELFCLLLTILPRSAARFVDDRTGILQEPVRSLTLFALPPALLMFTTYWAGYDLAMSLWMAPHFQASVPHDMVYALLGVVPADQSALVIPDYSKPIESVYFEVYKSMILHSNSLDIILINRICYNGQGPSWFLDVAPRLTVGPLWADKDKGNFKAAADVPMEVSFKDESRHLVSKGIRIGVLDTVVGPNRIAQLPTAANFRRFVEEIKAFAQGLSLNDDHEDLWRTLVMDHDTSDLLSPITPAPQHFGEIFDEAIDRKEVPADYRRYLSPDTRKEDDLQLSKFIYNMVDSTQNRCFFRTSCGKMGLGPYDSKPGDVVAALFGAKRFFMLRPIPTGYEVVGDAYIQGGMSGEFMSEYLNGDVSAVDEFVLW
ncbi:HET-domain-containing protein [Fusarium austroafricanum]|uniref:HET-domain-containing protein n=1 Tax=Fusarium austroafricanum TaxID=2364996 RepID=A0A8H4KHB3_9HYPO|nr:HET-domain-containing protein [Fusarium austroafricanum]